MPTSGINPDAEFSEMLLASTPLNWKLLAVAIKCRARIAGIFCRKTRNAATAAIGCAAQHKPRKAKRATWSQ